MKKASPARDTASFVAVAEGWNRWASYIGRLRERMNLRLLGEVSQASAPRVLDYGCATGEIGLLAAEARSDATVTGMDISAEMVRFACKRAGNLGLKNYRGLVCEPDSVNAPDSSFDVVYTAFVLEFVADVESVLSEIRRTLSPGGVLNVMTWGRPERCPVHLVVEEALSALRPVPPRGSGLQGIFRFSDPSEIVLAAQNSGFAGVEATVHSDDYVLDSLTDFIEMKSATSPKLGPLIAQLSQKERQLLLNLVASDSRVRTDGPHVRIEAQTWIFRATK